MKRMVLKRLISISIVVVILLFCVNLIMSVLNAQKKMVNDTETLFKQIKHIISDNEQENELSYIFSLLATSEGETLYAADKNSRIILGSTDFDAIGKTLSEVGFDEQYVVTDKNGFHDVINNSDVFCIFMDMDDIIIGRACTASSMYIDLIGNLLTITMFTIVITLFLVITIFRYFDAHVMQGISEINTELSEIAEGNWDEQITVDYTPEFMELSDHINSMITSLLSSTNKISNVLDQTQLRIGVYEYNKKMTRVRYTKQLPSILGLSEEDASILFSDYKKFEKNLKKIRRYPLENCENIYILSNAKHIHYVRMEVFHDGNSVLGIFVDETEDIINKMKLEEERDTDILTGLYNRKGLDVRLEKLLSTPDVIKHSAIIMLDADGLKVINDRYGHTTGDSYICEISNILRKICPKTSILSRQGGDEFVLFIYGLESDDAVLECINDLKAARDNYCFTTNDGTKITLKYSLGYEFYNSHKDDFKKLLTKADDNMYADKKSRKSSL